MYESLDNEDESLELSILDLEGVGTEIWQGVDAQAYSDELRQEWEHCS